MDKVIQKIKFGQKLHVPVYCSHIGFTLLVFFIKSLIFSLKIGRFFSTIFLMKIFFEYVLFKLYYFSPFCNSCCFVVVAVLKVAVCIHSVPWVIIINLKVNPKGNVSGPPPVLKINFYTWKYIDRVMKISLEHEIGWETSISHIFFQHIKKNSILTFVLIISFKQSFSLVVLSFTILCFALWTWGCFFFFWF